MFDKNVTKTKKTKRAYVKQARRLITKYKRENGVVGEVHFHEFLRWFDGMLPQWSKSTARQYKASISYYLEKTGKVQCAQLMRRVSTSSCKAPSSKLKGHQKKTSAKKQKYIKNKDLKRITEYLVSRRSRSYWAAKALVFLRAGLLVGLRPSEWQGSEIIYLYGKPLALRVINGKSTNGRSHGKYRTLYLEDYHEHEIMVIKYQVMYANNPVDGKGRDISFENYYEMCRRYLHVTNKRLFPQRNKTITLYSARHQFAANAKRSGASRAEVAALMGHGVDTTACRHYGKRRSGRAHASVPGPDMNEVARVRNKFKSFFNRVRSSIGLK